MNIVLCGFMGSGKTTVARQLHKRTGKKMIDIDTYIETKENRTIAEIFSSEGEAFFRALETAAVKEISHLDDHIISTGGGVILNEENRKELKHNGKIVYLHVTIDTVLARLKYDKTRPLLAGDKEKTILALYEKRLPMYETYADIIVDASIAPKKIASTIIKKISENT
ncbi:MAG: hypothetical protein BGN88_15670 [Clostridiales bacterium 43-6]|nr:MAG: hypothetical protein BGN88_15670 [Clostridiales bacterium 43-6]